jgi:hypothetical protein
VSPASSNGLGRAEVLAPTLDREYHQRPAVGHHPGEHRGADHPRTGRHDDLGDTGVPGEQRPIRVVQRPGTGAVLPDQRPRVVAEVRRDAARRPVGHQPVAEQLHDGDRPGQQRQADQREVEVAEPAGAGVHGGIGDDDVDRGPGQGEQRPGVRREDQRQQQSRR